MENIRLKMGLHLQQLQDRMKYNPEVIELHISEENLYHPDEVVKYIQVSNRKVSRCTFITLQGIRGSTWILLVQVKRCVIIMTGLVGN